jgi:tRNA1Val (adenine37-N6)-methyltransferase
MMGNKPFQFKQFAVDHSLSTHKVGTDGVLLGAWVNVSKHDRHILDVGTGSGLIALMLAQRTAPDTHIDAVEIDAANAKQAAQNVRNSPWPEKIIIHTQAIQQYFREKKYDLIVSNPPFFVNSLLPPDKRRSNARHGELLSFEDLLDSVTRLLKKDGRFCVILPLAEGNIFTGLATKHHLFAYRETAFRSRTDKPVERLLLEFSFVEDTKSETEIILYRHDGKWSEDYINLTGEFYLSR